MADYKKYINALRKCAKEHDNDTIYTGHIRVSDLCRDTADLLEVLEQEPILDKIRAEIEQVSFTHDFEYGEYYGEDTRQERIVNFDAVMQIIDKYRESEGEGKTN